MLLHFIKCIWVPQVKKNVETLFFRFLNVSIIPQASFFCNISYIWLQLIDISVYYIARFPLSLMAYLMSKTLHFRCSCCNYSVLVKRKLNWYFLSLIKKKESFSYHLHSLELAESMGIFFSSFPVFESVKNLH